MDVVSLSAVKAIKASAETTGSTIDGAADKLAAYDPHATKRIQTGTVGAGSFRELDGLLGNNPDYKLTAAVALPYAVDPAKSAVMVRVLTSDGSSGSSSYLRKCAVMACTWTLSESTLTLYQDGLDSKGTVYWTIIEFS